MILLRIDRAADSGGLTGLTGRNRPGPMSPETQNTWPGHTLTHTDNLYQQLCILDLILVTENSVCIIWWPNQVLFGLTLIQTSVTQKQVFDNVKKYLRVLCYTPRYDCVNELCHVHHPETHRFCQRRFSWKRSFEKCMNYRSVKSRCLMFSSWCTADRADWWYLSSLSPGQAELLTSHILGQPCHETLSREKKTQKQEAVRTKRL